MNIRRYSCFNHEKMVHTIFQVQVHNVSLLNCLVCLSDNNYGFGIIIGRNRFWDFPNASHFLWNRFWAGTACFRNRCTLLVSKSLHTLEPKIIIHKIRKGWSELQECSQWALFTLISHHKSILSWGKIWLGRTHKHSSALFFMSIWVFR